MHYQALCSAAAVVMWTAAAVAAPPQLKGDYAFTGSAVCLQSSLGFNANLEPVDPSTVVSPSFSIEGIRTFNGNGTGKVSARTVSTLPRPSNNVGVSSSDISYNFTYTVHGNGSFTTNIVPGQFWGTVLTGNRAGQTFTVDTLPLTGLISKDAKALTLASVEPTIQTQSFSNGDVRQRICHRSRVLIWMNK